MSAHEIRTLPYRLKIGDFLAFYLKVYYSGFVRFPRNLFFIVMIFGIPLSTNAVALIHGEYLGFIAASAGFIVLWLAIIPGLGLLSTWLNFRRNKGNSAERVAVLSDQGIRFEGEGTGSTLAWPLFTKAVASRHNLFLHTTPNCAHIIPKSAFTTSETCTAFLAAAVKHCAQASHQQIGAFYDVPKAAPAGPGDTPAFQLSLRTFLPLYLDIYYASLRQPLTFLLTAAIVIGLPAWTAMEKKASDMMLPAFFGAFIPIAFMTFIVAPPAMGLLSWRSTNKGAGAKGDRYVRMTDEGISTRGDAFDIQVKWRDLHHVKKSFGVFLFKTAPQSGIVLPISAFDDRTAAMAFYAEALSRWKAAQATK